MNAPLHPGLAFREEAVPAAFITPGAAYPLIAGAEPFFYKAGTVGCLLLHGYTSAQSEMRLLAFYLAERGITVGAPLLPGHGTAPEDLQGKTWQDWYVAVNRALDEMLAHCSRVFLIGLSLGGALTLYTAAHRGDELAGIVAMSSPIYIPHGAGRLLRGINAHVPFMNKPFRDVEDPEAHAHHISYLRAPMDSTGSLIEFLVHVRAALPQIKIPTLIIYARHDHVVPGISSHHIYSRLGTSEKKMIALHRGYHLVTVDTDREKVYSSIYEFISARQ